MGLRALGPAVRALLGGALLLWGLLCAAQTSPQAVPALSAHVIDHTGTLDANQRSALDARLVAFEQTSGTQLVVLLVPSTAPEDIASYANRVANAWKIGRKGVGDGLLLIVAKNDRKLRIEVAKALEGAIPDLAAKRVMDQTITPRFKQGDYAGGLNAGVEQLMQLVQHEALPTPTSAAESPTVEFTTTPWQDLLLPWLAFVGIFALSFQGARIRAFLLLASGGGAAGAAAWWLTAVMDNVLPIAIAGTFATFMLMRWFFDGPAPATTVAGRKRGLLGSIPSIDTGSSRWGSGSGSWGSDSGGGGFSSGGGGDFGGGGASGDW